MVVLLLLLRWGRIQIVTRAWSESELASLQASCMHVCVCPHFHLTQLVKLLKYYYTYYYYYYKFYRYSFFPIFVLVLLSKHAI